MADHENKVVALSGKWGTGKSHLWREVKANSSDEKIKNALYVSLFGLTSMDQIKFKIVQSSIPKAGESSTIWETTKRGWGAASKVLESLHKGFSALNEIALIAVPAILKNRIIVLDDIERKHKNLGVDEIMGFIDEFTQQHGARIILILNNDQLADRELWNTLREKVIDHEILLETSTSEAFEIASGIAPSPYADRIKKSVETCGITNIRIISKIIKAVDKILGRSDLSDDVLHRVIPSTVLLSAVHYKGIEDAPDFDFILKIGNLDDYSDWEKKNEELDDAGKHRAKWRIKLRELGINSCDEYEQIVVEFLRSGLFDVADVTKVIDKYMSEADYMRTIQLARQLQDHIIWHHTIDESELVLEAASLVERAHSLDAYNVTQLHESISKLTDGVPVADAMIDAWVTAFKTKKYDNIDFDNFYHRPIHPKIKAEFELTRATSQAKATIFEACSHIVMNSGWGDKQVKILEAASVKDFEDTIKTLEVEDLRLFMSKFIEMRLQSQAYESHFGLAIKHFIEACRNISNDSNFKRLGELITILFEDARLGSELSRPDNSIEKND
ncbi:MAG: hypothetical protein NVS3B3_19050 [Aquirhabdus sp.]